MTRIVAIAKEKRLSGFPLSPFRVTSAYREWLGYIDI